MLLHLRRFILARWTSFICYLSALWGPLFIDRVGQDPTRQHDKQANEPISPRNEGATNAQISRDPLDNFPPTGEQLDERITKFIDSISEDAVCRLASQYNGQRSCSVIKRDSGSFNVCFFVRFSGDDDMTWVVRIPLEPVVHNVWAKVQSEVATMRYIERNTTIPTPHVHAYGRGAELIQGSSTTQVFLICDYIPGQSLDIKMLANATKYQQEQFFDDLINILAQLRKLEFPTSGSLMPNPDNESETVMGDLLSMAANELQRCCPDQGRAKTFNSEEQYVAYKYHVLSETYRLPTADLDREQVQMELFALDCLGKELPKLVEPQRRNGGGSFVLAHPDLRCGNIIASEDFRIRAILDWEFASTIPPSLFTPPPWITGHDIDATAAIHYRSMYPEFLQVLEAKSTTSGECAKLRDDWKRLPDLAFPVAQIFRQPSTLSGVYYKFIFSQLFKGEDRTSVVSQFFERDQGVAGTLAAEVERRIEESSRYTQYLKDQGLYVVDQEALASQEWLAKANEFLKKTDKYESGESGNCSY